MPTPVILDFDFTLADSAEGAIECIGHALRTLGLRAAPDEIRGTIGLSLDASLEQLAGRLGPEDRGDVLAGLRRAGRPSSAAKT